MRRVIWSRRARADLHAIADHYDGIDPLVTAVLLERIRSGTAPLLDHPMIGTPYGALGPRKWTVRGAPFVLLYRPSRAGIEIVSVRHARQDWRKP